MNWFLILFAVFFVSEHLLGYGLTFLNLRHVARHSGQVPPYFQDEISLESYQKSIRYTRDKALLGVAASLAEIPIFWGLLLAGCFGTIDAWADRQTGSLIGEGLLFFAVVAGIFYFVSLPFNLYSTFVIERRYGFNQTPFKLWLVDRLKGLLLSVVVGVPLLAAILWFMNRYSGGLWWLYVWMVLALFQVCMLALFPVLILPLFNKLTPLPSGTLRVGIEGLARKVGFRISGIYTMDGSKRSTHSNAFFAGMGKFRRIVLFDTLIQSLKETELLAVLAHEMGHNIKKHVRTSLIIGLAGSLIGLFILSLLLKASWLYEAFGFSCPSSQAALFIFTKASGSFLFFLEPVFSMLSRRHEYQADGFAAEVMGDSHPMIASLVKLSRDNLSNLTPHPLYSFFYYSHPTTMERIMALETKRPAGVG
jgi:STE24 endopeptidase